MYWGTISSWIAAGIAVLTYAATVFRSWWNRPLADWSFSGELRWPSQRGDWLEIRGKLSNFGDGNAHRVSVWVHRNDEVSPKRVDTTPLLLPGDEMDFTCAIHIEDLKDARMWVTWTPPPLRRRSESTSPKQLAAELFQPTDLALRKIRKGLEIQDGTGNDSGT